MGRSALLQAGRHAFVLGMRRAGHRHILTRPCALKTNGKARRFVQTGLREWAWVRVYGRPIRRQAALQPIH